MLVTVAVHVDEGCPADAPFFFGCSQLTVGMGVTFSDVEWWGSELVEAQLALGRPGACRLQGFRPNIGQPTSPGGETWTTNTGNSSGPPATYQNSWR